MAITCGVHHIFNHNFWYHLKGVDREDRVASASALVILKRHALNLEPDTYCQRAPEKKKVSP